MSCSSITTKDHATNRIANIATRKGKRDRKEFALEKAINYLKKKS